MSRAGAAAAGARMRELGKAITPDMINGTQSLYAAMHPAPGDTAGMRVLRDQRYGADERHRLDVFLPAQAGGPLRPVLLFVHGGGFVQGDKTQPGKPYYDNVGRWAVANGMVGVTMTYRLAPAHGWPSGSDDVASAMKFLRSELAAHGGDQARICAMGQSAGAFHVAGYMARAAAKDLPASAVLVSGMYDSRTMQPSPMHDAYFGADHAVAASQSFIEPLAALEVPTLLLVSELDPAMFLQQAAELLRASVEKRGTYPRLVQLVGHNHLSPVLALGASGDAKDPPDTLGPALKEFLGRLG